MALELGRLSSESLGDHFCKMVLKPLSQMKMMVVTQDTVDFLSKTAKE